MTEITLRENVRIWEDGEKEICATLDIEYFKTLTDEQKSSYSSGFEPIKKNEFNFVVKHK